MTAPATTAAPSLAQYLICWLADVVQPSVEPATYAYYETMTRLYIVPALGACRLDGLEPRDVRDWLTQLATACQCCAQGKDAARPAGRQRCCSIGACCGDYLSRRTLQAARTTLRSALNHARTADGLTARNAAALAPVPEPLRPQRHHRAWSAAEAVQFLESTHGEDDPLYVAYVLVLLNGLRKGEVLGLPWPAVHLNAGQLDTGWQLQRVRRELLHRPRAGGGTVLPMPDLCVAALRLRREDQTAARVEAGNRWQDSELVFTTRWGRPVEPRNFNRSFDTRCAKAGVPRIRVHDARQTCAALLAALGVHPQVALSILRHAQVAMGSKAYAEHPADLTDAALHRLAFSFSGLPPVPQEAP